jgi:hypothetical protein
MRPFQNYWVRLLLAYHQFPKVLPESKAAAALLRWKTNSPGFTRAPKNREKFATG